MRKHVKEQHGRETAVKPKSQVETGSPRPASVAVSTANAGNASAIPTPFSCIGCSASFISDEALKKHFKKVHSARALEKKAAAILRKNASKALAVTIVKCPICQLEVLHKSLKKHKLVAHNIGVPLMLVSRRGTRIAEPKECVGCKKVLPHTWLYSNTTKGPVHICGECKPRYFDNSFGKIDALEGALRGGGFETKRRKF